MHVTSTKAIKTFASDWCLIKLNLRVLAILNLMKDNFYFVQTSEVWSVLCEGCEYHGTNTVVLQILDKTKECSQWSCSAYPGMDKEMQDIYQDPIT